MLFGLFGRNEYSVSPSHNEDIVTPEETLLDSKSVYADIETPIAPVVFRIVVVLIAVGLSVLAVTMFRISILRHTELDALAFRNRTVPLVVPPPRGLIVDASGASLVQNVHDFKLLVVSRDVRKSWDTAYDVRDEIAEIIGISPVEFEAFLQEGIANNAVFFAAEGLEKEKVLRIETLDLQGFKVISGVRRSYIDGQQFSTVLGYVGGVTKKELISDEYYIHSDSVGKTGIEAVYEKDLRGVHGNILFSSIPEEHQEDRIEAEVGNTVVLNIESGLQKKLFNEMFETIRSKNLLGGAAVIQNPQNGEVLAMVNIPSYDNNVFSAELSESDAERLFKRRGNAFFNRSIGGLYNPGSTIKPFFGMAALQEGTITSSTTIRDCISISIPNPAVPEEPYVFKNWRTDLGLFNLRRAIANSCNIFFFAVGGGYDDISGLGIKNIAKYLSLAGADEETGIDLVGEGRGFIPTPVWKQRERNEPWYLGDTYNVSIGQGDLLLTPIWINSYVSAIANGGTMFRPRVVSKIIDTDGNDIRVISQEIIRELPFDQGVVVEMKNNMRETVLSGTARLLQGLPIAVGAKTGTAEVIKGKSVNSIFMAFAPFDFPELAITVLVEGVDSGQGYAVRIANNVLSWYFDDRK